VVAGNDGASREAAADASTRHRCELEKKQIHSAANKPHLSNSSHEMSRLRR
jgi:hypothetical protein